MIGGAVLTEACFGRLDRKGLVYDRLTRWTNAGCPTGGRPLGIPVRSARPGLPAEKVPEKKEEETFSQKTTFRLILSTFLGLKTQTVRNVSSETAFLFLSLSDSAAHPLPVALSLSGPAGPACRPRKFRKKKEEAFLQKTAFRLILSTFLGLKTQKVRNVSSETAFHPLSCAIA